MAKGKIVAVIPAYNEEKSIGEIVTKTKKHVDEIIVVDDGSEDKTGETAEKTGARVITHKKNRGLVETIKDGYEEAIKEKADIIVQLDADGQYLPSEIPLLVSALKKQKADIVLGNRFSSEIKHMPITKKIGNKLASFTVKKISGFDISDSQTGFRALTKEALLRINLVSSYTYTQEMIIQAKYKGLKIVEIPCSFLQRKNGNSRLIGNLFSYAKNSTITILRTIRDYEAFKFFTALSALFLVPGLILGSYLVYLYLAFGAIERTPSIVLTALLVMVGVQIFLFGLLADMQANQRKILEETNLRTRKKT